MIPPFLDVFGSYDFLVRESLILLVVAYSIWLLLRAGMFALPQVGFMGVGGYTAAIAQTQADLPLPGRLVLAAVVTAAVAFVLGLALARLDGIYLAIATIGFSEIVRVVARNLDVTGGAPGMTGLDRTLPDGLVVATAAIVVVGLVRLERTRYGLALTTMREDSLTASHQGVNLRRYRPTLFVASGLLAGFAGGMHIHLRGFIEPSLFSFDLLITLLTATVIGGMNSVLGPLVGGTLVFSLPQLLRAVEEYRTLVNGALLVAVIAFAPSGLVDVPRRLLVAVRAAGTRHGAAETRANDVTAQRPGEETTAWLSRTLPDTATPPVVLQTQGLSKRFGGLQALHDIDVEVRAGEVLGLIGPNGSGKTTLLNLLSGVYRPDGGTGTVLGVPMDDAWGRPERLADAGVARTFQTIRLLDEHTVGENVEVGAYLRQTAPLLSTMLGSRRSSAEARAAQELVHSVLDLVGIADIADRRVGALPYGIRRRVEIARALVRGPGLLLLDEPTAGMTPAERDDVFALVKTVRDLGIAVLVVEHDVGSMTAHCDRLTVLNFGKVIAHGDPQTVIREEAVVDAYIGQRAAR